MSEGATEILTADQQQNRSEGEAGASAGFSILALLASALRKIGKAGKSALLFLIPKRMPRLSVLSSRTLSVLALIIAVAGFAAGQFDLPGREDNARIKAIERSLRTIETRLAIPGADRLHSADYVNQLLAIQFVTNAAERSTPFDTALAVAIRMTGDHEKLGPLLDELLIEAPNGVPSRDDLRSDFKARLAKFEQDGVVSRTTGTGGIAAFGLSGFLGLGAPETSEEDTAIIQKLSADIAADKFAEANQLVSKLDGALRDGLESWREKAMRRVALDETLAELRRIAFLGIIGNGS